MGLKTAPPALNDRSPLIDTNPYFRLEYVLIDAPWLILVNHLMTALKRKLAYNIGDIGLYNSIIFK